MWIVASAVIAVYAVLFFFGLIVDVMSERGDDNE